MPCRKTMRVSGGPPRLTGRVAGPGELGLDESNISRCYLLWTALYGSNCDFDDCLFTLAERLGYNAETDGADLDFMESIYSAQSFIETVSQSWETLRKAASDVFFTLRADSAVEVEAYDGRSWDQAVTDALYISGSCEACRLRVPGTPKEHRELAGWVLHGRTTWPQVEQRVLSQLASSRS